MSELFNEKLLEKRMREIAREVCKEEMAQRPLPTQSDTDPEIEALLKLEYLTVQQLAKLLQVAPKTIYNNVDKKLIPYYQLGDSPIRFKYKEVVRAMARSGQVELKLVSNM